MQNKLLVVFGFIIVLLTACGNQSAQDCETNYKLMTNKDDYSSTAHPDVSTTFRVLENGVVLFDCLEDMLTSAAFHHEFIEVDLNGDSVNELILQAKDGNFKDKKRIVSIFIFDLERGEVNRILHHDTNLARFWFLSSNGNVIHYFTSYDPYATVYRYSHYIFDENWNMIRTLSLEMTHDHQTHKTSFLAEFSKAVNEMTSVQNLSEQQFNEHFEELTGFPFSNIAPDFVQASATITTTMRIHPYMPEFTLKRILGDWVAH